MPWIDENSCIGCGICVGNCPSGAITIDDGVVAIRMDECIRCGTCHDICPREAIKHDSEKIPHEVESNVLLTRNNMDACSKHFGNGEEGKRCLERMMKHFNKEKRVAEITLEKLHQLKESTEGNGSQ